MIGIIVMGQRQKKIIKRRDRVAHRKYHINLAAQMRERAEAYRENMRMTIALTAGHLPDDIVAQGERDVEATYNNMLAEAIAEENSKCMDRKH